MTTAVWVSLVAILVSVVSAAFSGLTYRANRRSEREAYIANVAVHHRPVHNYAGPVDGRPRDKIVVRNDSPAAIVVAGVGLAYGRWDVLPSEYGVRRPWNLRPAHDFPISGHKYLGPGEQVELELADEGLWRAAIGDHRTSWGGPITAVAFITDVRGRPWQRTERGWTDLTHENHGGVTGRKLRRHVWMEQRAWVNRLALLLGRWVIHLSRERPGKLPWEFYVLEWAYGWRAGGRVLSLLPRNAPKTWQWQELLPSEPPGNF
ncbi:hypothetical protein ACI799_07605 [Blastococcus sp. SYSU DS0753]